MSQQLCDVNALQGNQGNKYHDPTLPPPEFLSVFPLATTNRGQGITLIEKGEL